MMQLRSAGRPTPLASTWPTNERQAKLRLAHALKQALEEHQMKAIRDLATLA